MNISVVYVPSAANSVSAYRLLDAAGQELAWANSFLDGKRLTQRSPRSLRAYAFDLLHFARWTLHPPRPLAELTEAVMEEYLRHQLDQQPTPAPSTINRRLGCVRALYRFHYSCDIPGSQRFPHPYTTRSPLGYGRSRQAVSYGLRLPQPHRIIWPLCSDDVAHFWSSFRHYRDLALVGLMLLDGLRCCEVLALQLSDLRLAEAQMLVHGKGNKERLLPLPQDIVDVLDRYLTLERPRTNSTSLFVCLKGRSRGLPLSPAGLRSLFRHHRAATHIVQANPHRFRHYASSRTMPPRYVSGVFCKALTMKPRGIVSSFALASWENDRPTFQSSKND